MIPKQTYYIIENSENYRFHNNRLRSFATSFQRSAIQRLSGSASVFKREVHIRGSVAKPTIHTFGRQLVQNNLVIHSHVNPPMFRTSIVKFSATPMHEPSGSA